ncbi:hypothetical protein [Lentzea flaviverrucosa]|uniref:hypothetical protein n=1 Tax=Lentzea flaviverrucosa TaxID=200379 RepID=UPI0011602BF4|nr:hypothetical protein [Lentzea flaviverrucosa]
MLLQHDVDEFAPGDSGADLGDAGGQLVQGHRVATGEPVHRRKIPCDGVMDQHSPFAGDQHRRCRAEHHQQQRRTRTCFPRHRKVLASQLLRRAARSTDCVDVDGVPRKNVEGKIVHSDPAENT